MLALDHIHKRIIRCIDTDDLEQVTDDVLEQLQATGDAVLRQYHTARLFDFLQHAVSRTTSYDKRRFLQRALELLASVDESQ